jgi:nucleoside-diphosphate-sugar epimerase
MSKPERILVIGSSGQIGTELVARLREIHGSTHVISADIRQAADPEQGPHEIIDVLDASNLNFILEKHHIRQVYLLAAMLSATGEKYPMEAWTLNMNGLFNVLEAAREKKIDKLFWPSSIAIFGPSTPKENTPQHTIAEPSTIYGISKLAGERWCEWYFERHGIDVRSIRYPGLISYSALPGGGTTDYAVHIFHEALKQGRYTSFLGKGTRLPMMYMPDAIEATIALMEAPGDQVRIRSSYNIAAMSFSPEELEAEIRKHLPDFTLDYAPDQRQQIANSWPQSIDDSAARKDWGWKHRYGIAEMTADMLEKLADLKLK